jgi:hypothetical protein
MSAIAQNKNCKIANSILRYPILTIVGIYFFSCIIAGIIAMLVIS